MKKYKIEYIYTKILPISNQSIKWIQKYNLLAKEKKKENQSIYKKITKSTELIFLQPLQPLFIENLY